MDEFDKQYPIDGSAGNEALYDEMYYYDQFNNPALGQDLDPRQAA